MKILDQILVSGIMVVCTSIATYIVGKRLIKTQKDEIFNEILEYLSTLEGQQSVRNLGTIFAQGISKGIGLGGSPLKGKTFGIPNQLLFPIVEKFIGRKTKEVINKETPVSGSGKFG